MPPRACPTYDPADIWLGQDHDHPEYGCDVGCLPCLFDGGQARIGVPDNGNRWVKPDDVRASRDARGLFHDLRANETRLYPFGITYWQRAPVWFNDGRECYGMSICVADPQLDLDWELGFYPDDPPTDCRDGTSFTELRTGPRADINFFVGSDYGNVAGADRWMHCRRENPPVELGPLEIVGHPEHLGNRLSLRSTTCMENMLIPCLGKVHPNSCTEPSTGFHNDSANREVWRVWHITRLELSLRRDDSLHHTTPEADAVLAVKNAALDYMGTNKGALHLDQLEKRTASGASDNFNTPNSDIGSWNRGFGADAIESAPRFLQLSHARLRFSGQPINVWLVIKTVKMQMHLILHTVEHQVAGEFETQIFPSVRFRLTAELGAYAEAQPGLPLATNSFERLPRVAGDVIDYIDDEGRAFVPPAEVLWDGSRQEITDESGKWEDILEDSDIGGTTTNYCLGLARLLNTMRIAAAPTMFTDEHKIRHFGGDIVMGLNA